MEIMDAILVIYILSIINLIIVYVSMKKNNSLITWLLIFFHLIGINYILNHLSALTRVIMVKLKLVIELTPCFIYNKFTGQISQMPTLKLLRQINLNYDLNYRSKYTIFKLITEVNENNIKGLKSGRIRFTTNKGLYNKFKKEFELDSSNIVEEIEGKAQVYERLSLMSWKTVIRLLKKDRKGFMEFLNKSLVLVKYDNKK